WSPAALSPLVEIAFSFPQPELSCSPTLPRTDQFPSFCCEGAFRDVLLQLCHSRLELSVLVVKCADSVQNSRSAFLPISVERRHHVRQFGSRKLLVEFYSCTFPVEHMGKPILFQKVRQYPLYF